MPYFTLHSSKKHRKYRRSFHCIKKLVRTLMKDTQSRAFNEPVDYGRLKLPMYPILIKKPMDLSTVKRNVKQRLYARPEEALADIQLVWDNCKTFNVINSVLQCDV